MMRAQNSPKISLRYEADTAKMVKSAGFILGDVGGCSRFCVDRTRLNLPSK